MVSLRAPEAKMSPVQQPQPTQPMMWSRQPRSAEPPPAVEWEEKPPLIHLSQNRSDEKNISEKKINQSKINFQSHAIA